MGKFICPKCGNSIFEDYYNCPVCNYKFKIGDKPKDKQRISQHQQGSESERNAIGNGNISWIWYLLLFVIIIVFIFILIFNRRNSSKLDFADSESVPESEILPDKLKEYYLVEPKTSKDSDQEDEINSFHLKKICAEEVPQIRSTINNLTKDVKNLESTAKSNYGSDQFFNYLTNWNRKALTDYDNSKLKCEDPYISATYGQILYFKWLYGKEFIDPSNYGSLDMKTTRKDLFDYINELQYILKCYDRFYKNCVVKSKSLNIREGPEKDYYGVIGKLNYNEKVYVIDVEYDWCKIKKDNKTGWVLYKYLDPI